jgi:hypothetical protein
MSIKRYDPDTKSIGCGDFVGVFVEEPAGDYVLYTDHAAEVSRLEERVAEMEEQLSDKQSRLVFVTCERDSLRRKHKEAQNRIDKMLGICDQALAAPAASTPPEGKVREAYEAGYMRGHNDTVEGRVVDADVAALEFQAQALALAAPAPAADEVNK